MTEHEYRYVELYHWLDPLLTQSEYEFGIDAQFEAESAAVTIPTGDHWS